MIPGLDATHSWDGGAIVLNDKTVWPRFVVREIPGLHSLPDKEDRRDLPIARPYREITRKSYRRGKALVYQGKIMARTYQELDQAIADMTEAFADTGDKVMTITPYGGGQVYQYYAEATALDIPEDLPDSRNKTTYGFERRFTLGLRMSDARFYELEENEEASPAGSTSEGGVILPATLPAVSVSEVTIAGVVEVDAGAVAVDPEIDIIGPAENPIVKSDTLDRQLAFDLALIEGQILTLDFYNRSIVSQGVDFRATRDDPNSDWWDGGVHGLAPGINQLSVSSGSLSVRWRRARLG